MRKQFYSAYPNLNALRAELSSDFIESEKYNKPQMNADERRLIASSHRKGREERKAQQHKSLYIYKIIRPGTRMTRIGRIFTDNEIRAHLCHPCNPCSIVYNSDEKIRYKWHFSSITEQVAAQ